MKMQSPKLVMFVGFVVSAIALSAPTNAQVTVFEQDPITLGNPSTGNISLATTESNDPGEPRARAFDNFTLATQTDLIGLTWMGAFNNEFNPESSFRGDVDFRIEIFPDVANSPDLNNSVFTALLDGGTAGNNDGTQIVEAIVPNVLQRDGGVIVDYEADLNLTLNAGDYWLSIVGVQTFPSPHPDAAPSDPNAHLDPTFSWVFSPEGDKTSYSFDQQFDPSEPGIRIGDGTTCAPFGSLPGCDLTFSLLAAGDPPVGLFGDFDMNGLIEAEDIDILSAEVRNSSTDLTFDLNDDGSIDPGDRTAWVDGVGTLFGDADLNGVVAFADFLALAQNFGLDAGWGQGDFDGDATIRFADFLVLAQNFGLSANAASAVAVPEPASFLNMLAVLVFGVLRTRKSMRKSVDVRVAPAMVCESR